MSEEKHEENLEQPSITTTGGSAAAIEKNDDWVRSIAEAIRTIVIVILLAYLLRFFVFQPYIVEGTSMAPHLATNDYLIVSKLDYDFSKPERGDVIVFNYPNDPTLKYVKRVIGLPGEKVAIRDGNVYIYNTEHPNGFRLDESAYLDSSVKTTVPANTNAEFTVVTGTYFVLGDNRPASSDSREWGLLPQSEIIGRVALKAYPLSTATVIHRLSYDGF